jgi:tetratricopeptide (TPR) repeat protein
MSFAESPDEELWLATKSDHPEERAEALQELGTRAFHEANWPLAKTLFGSAADLFQELDNQNEVTKCIYSVGFAHYRLGEHEEAITMLTRALESAQELVDSRTIAFSAAPLADCYSYQGDDQKAIKFYELAIEAFDEIEDPANAGFNAISLGELHGKASRQAQALQCFIRSYNNFQSIGDAYGAARAKDRMAAALIELGDLDQAIQHIEDALNTFAHLEEEERVAFMRYRLGWTLVLNEKYARAIPELRTAAAYFRSTKDWSMAAAVELQLAIALADIDPDIRNEESEQLFTRLNAFFESVGEITNALIVQSFLGERLFDAGSYEAAATVFSDIIDRAIEIDDPYIIRATRAALAEALFKAGRITEAKNALAEIDASEWGENKKQLERLERVKKLMLDTMALTLNIEVD